MSLIDRIKGMRKKEKIVLASVVTFIVVAIVAVVLLLMRNNYLATTMRLLRVEGTVTIEDSTGTTKPVIDNIRFESGDALSTGSDGLASVGLDDTKIVTLENDSRVEFQKHNKQLELNLTQGGLFFEVTEKLTDDEKYEIKTSNMTVGIRGTSGYVYYSESGLQSLIITDGVVKVTGYNPKTQETKVVEVHGGEKVTAYLYDESTEDRDSIEFEVVEVPEEELPEFPLQMLAENEALLDKVCAETGWNKDELLALVEALTDPEGPTPTPDEIIEITDTPDPTVKPTNNPTLTPTPTDTVTPSPSASPKPTKKPTATPTPSADPTANPTQAPTSAPTTSPSVTNTPTPTTKPTSTPTTTPTPTVTNTPTPEPTVKPMGGCTAFSLAWEIEFDESDADNDTIYICYQKDGNNNYSYYGYVEEDGVFTWMPLVVQTDNWDDDNNPFGMVYFSYNEDYLYYYGFFEKGELLLHEPVADGPFPSY